ncbi:hypothetical protein ScPMuIL_008027 [Solemya velum]
MAISVLQAIQNGDTETAKKLLLRRCYNNIDQQTERADGTALYWACCRGFLEIAHILLIQGADANATNSYGATPLHAAADKNYLDIVKLLIQLGADVDAQTMRGDTPCHLAAYRGHPAVVETLVVNGADLELVNVKRHTSLDEAQKERHTTVARYLEAVLEIVYTHRKARASSQRAFDENVRELTSTPLYCLGTPQAQDELDCSPLLSQRENDLSLSTISVMPRVPLTLYNKF